MRLIIFEDGTFENFYPLTLTRPVFDLRCGHTSLSDKIIRNFTNLKTAYFLREQLAPVFRNRHENTPVNDQKALLEDDLLVINGRLLWLDFKLDKEGPEEAGFKGEDLVYLRVSRQTVMKFRFENFAQFLEEAGKALPRREVQCHLITYPWELVQHNPKAIEQDFYFARNYGILGKFAPQSVVYGKQERVYVASTAEVQPFVCIDTNHGPVTIDEGAVIHPFTRIEGPAYIGPETIVYGAKIREGTSLGPVCRIGGEVEESIVHGFTNKYHDGFLGHSYLGEWINLGALTTNSDLKNTYDTISVHLRGADFDTKDRKVGLFMGDHTKTSIGTLFNTGSVIGAMCVIVGGNGILPKFLPSFCWYINGMVTKGFGFTKLLEMADVAMSRRGKKLTPEDVELLKYAREITKEERQTWIKKGRKDVAERYGLTTE